MFFTCRGYDAALPQWETTKENSVPHRARVSFQSPESSIWSFLCSQEEQVAEGESRKAGRGIISKKL